MTTRNALDRFNRMGEQPWWIVPYSGDASIIMMAAAASLSGMLDDCRTDEDLRQAVEHFDHLANAGVMTEQQWAAEGVRIDDELMQWGRRMDRRLRQVAESN